MTKLDKVKVAKDYMKALHRSFNYCGDHAGQRKCETIQEALAIYEAILEKRVLLVPVEPMYELLNAMNVTMKQYKAMTQAVDTEKLIEEIQ